MEKLATVMVGLPGLGKSTHIQKMCKDNQTWVYSTDMYIEAVAEDNGLTYSEAFESNIKAATEFNEEKLKTMMILGKDIIFDQTNLGLGKRRKIINRMKQANYDVDCIYLRAPLSGQVDNQKEWARRLNDRPGKSIPQHVLSNMIERLVEPSIGEGFTVIRCFNMYGDLLYIDYDEDH